MAKKASKKVYVVGTQTEYINFIEDAVLVRDMSKADIVLFTGGEDVTPSFYGHKDLGSGFNTQRDEYEKKEFKKIRTDQLAIGVCRGSQFLCVMNGGSLIQDCNCHAIFGTHTIMNEEGMCYDITSTHHQMQYPYDLPSSHYQVLFEAFPKLSMYYNWDGGNIDPENFKEPEIVLYNVPNNPVCLAIQGHPEYMDHENSVIPMLNTLIDDLLKQVKNA